MPVILETQKIPKFGLTHALIAITLEKAIGTIRAHLVQIWVG